MCVKGHTALNRGNLGQEGGDLHGMRCIFTNEGHNLPVPERKNCVILSFPLVDLNKMLILL